MSFGCKESRVVCSRCGTAHDPLEAAVVWRARFMAHSNTLATFGLRRPDGRWGKHCGHGPESWGKHFGRVLSLGVVLGVVPSWSSSL